jgi:hypothetical protein
VGVVVRALHDAATTGLDGLGGGVDVVGLDADDDLPGNGMVDLGGQCEGDRPAVESGEVGAVAMTILTSCPLIGPSRFQASQFRRSFG